MMIRLFLILSIMGISLNSYSHGGRLASDG